MTGLLNLFALLYVAKHFLELFINLHISKYFFPYFVLLFNLNFKAYENQVNLLNMLLVIFDQRASQLLHSKRKYVAN